MPTPRSPYETLACYFLALATFLLDQLSKLALVGAIAFGHSRPLIDGLFHLTHVRNEGAAWSLFWGHPLGLAVVVSAIVVGLVSYERFARERGLALTLGLGLVPGGALGNLYDRVFLGYVRDMFDLRWGGENIFPIFNVADIGVCIGMGALILHQHLASRRHELTTS
jgi:signal peptidase II